METPIDLEACNDTSITHHVVDRPLPDSKRLAGREYIQPQWIFDSCNFKVCLPISPYSPGASLPAHLSPFVDDENEGYIPKQKEIINEWISSGNSGNVQLTEGEMNANDDEDDLEAEFAEGLQKELEGKLGESTDSEDNEESDKDDAESSSVEKKPEKKRSRKVQEQEDAETLKELAKTMMTKKQARLYSRMQYGIEKKRAANELLLSKRRKLDSSN